MRQKKIKICEKCGAMYYEYEGGFVPQIKFPVAGICPKCKIKKIIFEWTGFVQPLLYN